MRRLTEVVMTTKKDHLIQAIKEIIEPFSEAQLQSTLEFIRNEKAKLDAKKQQRLAVLDELAREAQELDMG